MYGFPLGNDGTERPEYPESERPGHGVVAVDDVDDPPDQLVHAAHLVQMSLALLTDPEDAELEEVGSLPEDVGQLQHRRVDQDGERVLLKKTGESAILKMSSFQFICL